MPPALHDYQVVARDFLRQKDRAAIWMEMGTGKTATVLSALEPRHLPVLVTAPKRVAEEVWPEEVQKWRPDLKIALAAGSPAKRAAALRDTTVDIVVIGRDNLADAEKVSKRFRTFVLDESSSFKTKSSNRWRSANRIGKVVPGMWQMTGTPSPNGLMDTWAQIALLDKGKRLGTTLGAFRSRYFYVGKQMPNGVVIEWVIRPGAEKRIHKLLEDIVLGVQADGRVRLPGFTLNPIQLTMPRAIRTIYDEMKQDLVTDLGLLGAVHSATNAAVLSSRLCQITAGFMYHDESDAATWDWIHNIKMDALAEIIEGTASPVFVFYRFTAEKAKILERFPQAQTIDQPYVQARWNAGEIPLLVAHPASAGHGLNLQQGPGHTMVWTSLPWSLEEWEQGNARLHRQGQKNPVVSHVLMMKDSIDARVYRALVKKEGVQNALKDHVEMPL